MEMKIKQKIKQMTLLNEEEIDVVFLGLAGLLHTAFIFIVLVLIAAFKKNLSQLIIMLSSLLPLRANMGKIHLKTRMKCFIATIILINIMLFTDKYLDMILLKLQIIGATILLLFIIKCVKKKKRKSLYLTIMFNAGIVLYTGKLSLFLISLLSVVLETIIFVFKESYKLDKSS